MSTPSLPRVVSIIPDYGVGGAERVAVQLLVSLARMGHEVVSLSLFPRRGTAFEGELDRGGVESVFLDKRLGPDPTIPWKVLRFLRQHEPDVVHTHRYALGYALPGIIALRPKVAVHTVHNLAEKEVPALGRLLHGIAFRLGVHPVAIAEEVAQSVNRVYHRRPRATIPNGIRLSDYRWTDADRSRWRKENRIPPDAPVIMCIARHSPQKNVGLLIRSFAAIAGVASEPVLVLVGDGPQRNELENAARQLTGADRVRFLGVRNDITQCLAGADIVALTSDWEGNPLSVMEAMAAGRPVLATAVGGVPELIESGASGLLVPPGDEASVTAALRTLLDDAKLRSDLGARASHQAAERFGLAASAEGYSRLYTELAATS